MPTSLTVAAADLGGSEDGCIATTNASRGALASALEPQAAAIDDYLRDSLPEDAYYRRVVLGPTYVRHLVHPLPASAPSVADWDVLRQTLEGIQGAPVDLSWVSLNEATRSVMFDDWNRVMGHVDDAKEAAAARARPGIIHHNDGVQRDGETIHVRLDPGPFAGSEEALRAIIEPVWTNDTHRLVIDFVSGDPRAFRIVLDGPSGGRSLVRWSDKTVHLYPDVRERSIAHEIGHVLGFVDHYETVFDAKSCTYTETADPSDLMADPSRGSVNDEEWSALDAAYRASS